MILKNYIYIFYMSYRVYLGKLILVKLKNKDKQSFTDDSP